MQAEKISDEQVARTPIAQGMKPEAVRAISDSEVTICAIHRDLLRIKAVLPDGTSASVADRIGSHLWKACKHSSGHQSPQTLLVGIASGEDLLLLALEGTDILGIAIITKQVFPTGKMSIFIRVVSGDCFDSWKTMMIQEIEKIGVEMGCSSVVTCGRHGWERKHSAEAGYKRIHSTYEKVLEATSV